MLFNSFVFIFLFLPCCICLYYMCGRLCNHKISLMILSFMSLIFYGYFNPSYLLILCGSVLLNWIISRLMIVKNSKIYLIIGIICNIAIIFYYKYYDFFIANLNVLFKTDYVLRNIILPLGISFFTFQQISYLVDSYNGDTQDYKFIEYVTYVCFFPQLVAGPIVLHSEFIPQVRNRENWRFNHESFAEGIYVFAIGLFKKVLLADTFALVVTWAWNSINVLTSVDILITMLCYTFQIYFDFSGYSDMAYGLGKMFNITFPRNFNSPYKALSILDFWDRWHMTLTRFLRKYIYFPLGGSRCGTIRTYINIFVVFLISGIWHGANWTFILWGILHGVANIFNRMAKNFWSKVPKILRWICTFSFVNVLWLLFRTDNIGQFCDLMTRMLRFDGLPISTGLSKSVFVPEIEALNVCFERVRELSLNSPHVYVIVFILIGLLICMKGHNVAEKEFRPSIKNSIVCTICLVWSIISFSNVSTFIYFNF